MIHDIKPRHHGDNNFLEFSPTKAGQIRELNKFRDKL